MTIKDPLIFIEHILENIKEIEFFTKGLSKEKLIVNKLEQYAVIRALEVIGEAVKNIPIEFRKKYPNIPWKEIAGMKDKLMHHYFGVNLDTVWKVIKDDLPELKKEILEIKDKLTEK